MDNLSPTLTAFEALSPHLDLSGITTKSDLLEFLIERHHAWRQHDKTVTEHLCALLPKEEMNDFLAAVDRKADEDRMLSERLIKCLVGAGIPVIRESLEVFRVQETCSQRVLLVRCFLEWKKRWRLIMPANLPASASRILSGNLPTGMASDLNPFSQTSLKLHNFSRKFI